MERDAATRQAGGPAVPAGDQKLDPLIFVGWVAMVVGMFMAILDIQIVASSLSEIQAGLSASADEIKWVQTSYLVGEVVMIPLSGFLARMMGTRWVFVLSCGGFTISSLACAFAWDLNSMILFRAVQGFLGGAMIPTVFATAYSVFRRSGQSGATVVIGLVATLAPTIGPTVGGWITETISWHWLFFVNVIPGILVTVVVGLVMDVDRGDRSLLRGFDVIGLFLMAVFLGTLQYVLDEGAGDDWFQDPTITRVAIVSAVAGGLFLWRVFRYEHPIVDLRILEDRNFAVGCLFSFVVGVGLYGSVYILPVMLAQVRGFNAMQIGEIMAVTGAAQFACAPLVGRLSRVLDLRAMLAFGLLVFAAGLGLNGFNTSEVGFDELLLPQAIRGVGIMFCMIPVNILSLGTLPRDKLKNASGLFNFMRNLGGAFGLAWIGTAVSNRFDLHFTRLGEYLNPGRGIVQSTLSGLSDHFTDLVAVDPDLAAMKTLSRIVNREASIMAFNDMHLMMAGVFILGLFLMPLVRKPRQAPAGGGH